MRRRLPGLARQPTLLGLRTLHHTTRPLFKDRKALRVASNARCQPSRTFITESLPSVLIPPVFFTGLFVALWTYKILMTVLFQNKLLYLSYLPPFTRSEKVEDYVRACQPVIWHEETIRSMDRTKLTICVGELNTSSQTDTSPQTGIGHSRHVIICYFHGNGGSLPPRLPMLSGVMKAIRDHAQASGEKLHITLVALSYRGYWTSSGRVSGAGIELDAEALLHWVKRTFGGQGRIILWGQSIGAGIACTAAVNCLKKDILPVNGLIMETPFTSVKAMLISLYPQKWLPYKYLGSFIWRTNHWDSEAALRQISSFDKVKQPAMMLLPAAKDEVVPPEEADRLENLSHTIGLNMERKDVLGSLHMEASVKSMGKNELAKFMVSL